MAEAVAFDDKSLTDKITQSACPVLSAEASGEAKWAWSAGVLEGTLLGSSIARSRAEDGKDPMFELGPVKFL